MTPDFFEKALLVGIAVGCGVIGKILFDWLDKKGEQPEKTSCGAGCVQHNSLEGRVIKMENCVVSIKKDQAALSASFQSHAEVVDRRLEKGNQNFIGLRDDISMINSSLVKIATIIEERYGNGK